MTPAADLAGASKPDESEISRVFREESGRAVAGLIRVFGDIDLAEDAVQDAFAIALQKWQQNGFPANPGGWIMTTARNQLIDRFRRDSRGRELLGELARLTPDEEPGMPADPVPVPDERLRLMFTCCHPSLATEAQVALTLRLLGGLSTKEVAQAFLVSEAAMAQRLARAKRKIKAARIPYRVPDEHELPDRLRPVLAVVYLVYTTGANTTESILCAEAIRLARVLTTLMPDETEVAGLLALLLYNEARRGTRIDPDSSLVLLADQDRTRWDHALIEEANVVLADCLRRPLPGPYVLQAAINASHANARTMEATDWTQIVNLYDRLFELLPTPVVALNRAIAIGEVEGPQIALGHIDELDPELDTYYAFHATRADLLSRLGRKGDAARAYLRAAELAPTAAERSFLKRGGRSEHKA
jgi:RNA polymerase sigma-70 factor, ECF subfamily